MAVRFSDQAARRGLRSQSFDALARAMSLHVPSDVLPGVPPSPWHILGYWRPCVTQRPAPPHAESAE